MSATYTLKRCRKAHRAEKSEGYSACVLWVVVVGQASYSGASPSYHSAPCALCDDISGVHLLPETMLLDVFSSSHLIVHFVPVCRADLYSNYALCVGLESHMQILWQFEPQTEGDCK